MASESLTRVTAAAGREGAPSRYREVEARRVRVGGASTLRSPNEVGRLRCVVRSGATTDYCGPEARWLDHVAELVERSRQPEMVTLGVDPELIVTASDVL